MDSCVPAAEEALKPLASHLRRLLQSSGLLEQMGCTRHDAELVFAAQSQRCASIQPQYLVIFFANDEEHGSMHSLQRGPSEVRPPAA